MGSPTKHALITGVIGQDGACLAECLLDRGYEVHGIKRRASSFNTKRIDRLYRDPHDSGVRFFLRHGDVTDSSALIRIMQQVQPDEVYNCSIQSHVAVLFEQLEYTAYTSELGTLLGGASKAKRELGWESKIGFNELVRETAQADLHAAQLDGLITQHGYHADGFNE